MAYKGIAELSQLGKPFLFVEPAVHPDLLLLKQPVQLVAALKPPLQMGVQCL